MIPKLAELFTNWFRGELYGSEDRIKALIMQQGEQHVELDRAQYDFPEMFATLEEQIVTRVVAEMNKQSIRIVPSRKKVIAPADVQVDTTPEEG